MRNGKYHQIYKNFILEVAIRQAYDFHFYEKLPNSRKKETVKKLLDLPEIEIISDITPSSFLKDDLGAYYRDYDDIPSIKIPKSSYYEMREILVDTGLLKIKNYNGHSLCSITKKGIQYYLRYG